MNNISSYIDSMDLLDKVGGGGPSKITEASPAVLHFSQDFDLMRKKFLGM